MGFRLHGVSVSPWVKRCRVLLIEKGFEFEVVPYAPLGEPPPEFLAISPLGKIPALEHDGFAIADSLAICLYLEKLRPEPAFFPTQPRALAQAMWINQYAEAFFQVEGPIFSNRRLRPLLGAPVDEAALAAAEAKLPGQLAYLESQLEGREWFAGDAFGIADLTIAALMAGLRNAECLPAAATCPRLMALVERVFARESFAPLLREDDAMLAGLAKS